ncbi:MAG: TonB-dependent receptor [Pseudomonadota bacterium]|nr:TonB-dependent receptor [Pseudomonadota bacterium]
MRNFQLNSVALAVFAMLGSAQAQQAPQPKPPAAAEVGKITVTGEGDKLGAGLIIDEDTPKAKSTVTKAQLDKIRSSSNPYQALAILPGVNATSQDATGLFGGNLRVRGFNSDQMGFTINGAPVNDSGSFSVFPQEYTDTENLCELFVTQGATDVEAPHVGASGGNIGLITCAPSDKRGFRVAYSGGGLHFYKTFLRFDTGKIGDFKMFGSYSRADANKFKGNGKAQRDHVDSSAEYDLGKGSKLSASLLYNHAITNNYRTLAVATALAPGVAGTPPPSLNNGGLTYYDDFSSVIPQHLTPVNGTAQNEAPIASATAYYGYALNPFDNYLITLKGNFQLTPKLRVDVEPYYWYGYGTGGTQQTSIAESANAGTRLHGGIRDINGDGDTLDTILAYRGSVTETHRPGITVKASYTLDGQKILGGVWVERARHQQTQPATRVGNDGTIGDKFLNNPDVLLRYQDGTFYQGRNTKTISTAESVFISDTVDLLNSKLTLVPGFSYRRITRDFNNYANSGFGAGADYAIKKNYSEPLPSLGVSYMATDRLQAFANGTRNFKVPGNFDFFGLINTNAAAGGAPIVYANGAATTTPILLPLTVKQETTNNFDFGLRFRGDLFKASITGFYTQFKNRIATAYDPDAGISHDYNVGGSKLTGVEIEGGTAPIYGFSAYASAAFTHSTINSDLPIALGACPAGPPRLTKVGGAYCYANTAGQYFPDTPLKMFSASVQYATGPFLVQLTGKYTGQRYLTLVNDVSLGGYTLFDLAMAYKIPTGGATFFKNPTLRVNLTNLTNRRYYIANSGSGSFIGVGLPSNVGASIGGNPAVYSGAPHFASFTLQSDF